MKLTPRGKDYLKAIVAGAILATVIDVKIVLALCFSLLIAAILSEIALARANKKNIQIIVDPAYVKCFKGEDVIQKIQFLSRMRRWVSVSISGVVVPEGVEARIEKSDEDVLRVSFRSTYAGRFIGLRVRFDLNDPLQLFSKTVEISKSDFTIDCYPSSILLETRTSRPMTPSLGELAGGTKGLGTELYSIDEYQSSIERKNIFWRKVASMPDERMLVKTRESEIPKTLSISLIQTTQRTKNLLEWMDMACEGAALIGRTILELGCDVEVAFKSSREITRRYAADISELSDAIMEMSTSSVCDLESASDLLSESDICITGFSEIQVELLAFALARKPTLLIEDPEAQMVRVGDLAIVFNGGQDVTRLVSRVVGA